MRAVLKCLLVSTVASILIKENKKEDELVKLPALDLNPDTITVSGGSSGGYFCNMMLIIYSKTIKGCGDIAGGPWKIGEDKHKAWTSEALTDFIVKDIKKSGENGMIDDPANLKGATLATLIETKDWLAPTVWKEAEIASFNALGVNTYSRTINIYHLWPRGNSSEPKGECTNLAISKKQSDEFRLPCDYDWTGEMLKHMLFNIPDSGFSEQTWNPREGGEHDGTWIKFDQREFVEDHPNSAISDMGQVYIPHSCEKNSKQCHLHVYFHTCKDLGDHDQIKH